MTRLDSAQENHRYTLSESGFAVFGNLLPAQTIESLASAYDSAMAAGKEPDLGVSRDGKHVRLARLMSYDTAFGTLLELTPVLDACRLVIGERFKLSGLRARTLLPGANAQKLHVDVAFDTDDWPVVGFILMLDDFSAANGATRFVPGSHVWAQDWQGSADNHRPDHPDQVCATGESGSVIVFNGSTWHGHGANCTPHARRSVQGTFIPASGACAEDGHSLRPHISLCLRGDSRNSKGPQ